MEFTYDAYKNLIRVLKKNKYVITDYHNYQNTEYPCILRHDIDYSLEKAVRFAQMEASMGVRSTYFVMITSQFYNVLSGSVQSGSVQRESEQPESNSQEVCRGEENSQRVTVRKRAEGK